ncbi:nucleoporin protein Ndc1-Nup, partial [Sphaerosporella brunnea]
IAFWELRYISENRADRRVGIFTDVDRKPQPTIWQQIVVESLRCVNEVEIKLSELQSPSAPAAAPTPSTPSSSSVASPPHIPMGKTENIFVQTSSRSPVRDLMAMVQSTDGGSSPAAALRQRLPLPESLSASTSQISVVDSMKNTIIPLLSSPYGKPFRQTVQRVTSGAIPNPRIPKDAITALGNMVIASLAEDEYGNVQRDVRAILESFCATLDTLKRYVANPPLHWTDTEAREAPHLVYLEEPTMLIQQLEKTLREITLAFEPFMDELGIPASLR